MPTMTATEFIASAFADAWAYDDPQPITPEEAAYTMEQWRNEGICYPPTVTPVLFSRYWNILCNKYHTTK